MCKYKGMYNSEKVILLYIDNLKLNEQIKTLGKDEINLPKTKITIKEICQAMNLRSDYCWINVKNLICKGELKTIRGRDNRLEILIK